MSGRYQPSRVGVGEMLCAPFMQGAMLERITKVAAVARATAPYDAQDRDGHHYRDDFTVSSGIQSRKTRRAVGTLTNTNEAAVYVEFGNRNTPKHATMRNALRAAKG